MRGSSPCGIEERREKYSENKILAISMSTSFSQSFEAEAIETLLYAAKIPIKGVDNSKVEEWVEKTLKNLT